MIGSRVKKKQTLLNILLFALLLFNIEWGGGNPQTEKPKYLQCVRINFAVIFMKLSTFLFYYY